MLNSRFPSVVGIHETLALTDPVIRRLGIQEQRLPAVDVSWYGVGTDYTLTAIWL